MTSASTFQLGLIFFGLTSNNSQKINELRTLIYKQIHQICFYGQGGYSWPVVYNMPLYLRNFIFNEIKIYHDEQNKQSSKSSSPNKKVVSPTNFNSNKPNPKPNLPQTFSLKNSPKQKMSIKYK